MWQKMALPLLGIAILLVWFIIYFQPHQLNERSEISTYVPNNEVMFSPAHNNDASEQPRGRYLTTDEMLYVLYGKDNQLSVHSEQILQYIRNHIVQQSPTRPSKLSSPRRRKDVSQFRQSTYVDNLLSHRRNGFFIECGAADGNRLSNSLFFERERNWTGILIEPNPGYFAAMLNTNRRAYFLNACLSTKRKPMTVSMIPNGVLGGIEDNLPPNRFDAVRARKVPKILVHCFPLNSIMASINISHVNYLSLDVEGPELEILNTIDWTQLRIDVITVEYFVRVNDKQPTLKKLNDLRQFFRQTNLYREEGILPPREETRGLDVVFSRIT